MWRSQMHCTGISSKEQYKTLITARTSNALKAIERLWSFTKVCAQLLEWHATGPHLGNKRAWHRFARNVAALGVKSDDGRDLEQVRLTQKQLNTNKKKPPDEKKSIKSDIVLVVLVSWVPLTMMASLDLQCLGSNYACCWKKKSMFAIVSMKERIAHSSNATTAFIRADLPLPKKYCFEWHQSLPIEEMWIVRDILESWPKRCIEHSINLVAPKPTQEQRRVPIQLYQKIEMHYCAIGRITGTWSIIDI